MLRLHTFGTLALQADDRPLRGAATQRRRIAVLAFIAAAGPRGVSRERIIGVFWPESEEERARRALNQAIYALRKDLDADDLVMGVTDLRLNPAVIASDVGEFEEALDDGSDARAVELYRGPFLEGVHLSDASEFEQWAAGERQRLSRRYTDALQRLAAAAEANGDTGQLVRWRRLLAVADPLNSRHAYELMQALVEAGDRAGALQHARVHSALLQSDLGIEADTLVAELAERLLSERRSSAPTPVLAVAPAETAPAEDAPAEAIDRSAAERESDAPDGAPWVTPTAELTTEPPPAPAPEPDLGAVPPDIGEARPEPEPVLASEPVPAPPPPARPARSGGSRRRGFIAGVVAVLVLLVVAGAFLRGRRGTSDLRDTLVVVTPFAVLDPSLSVWEEGMADVLSRNLDGAGPLRTVSPSVVMKSWEGSPDPEAATEAARRSKARIAVFGHLFRVGTDSVRVEASVLDAATGEVFAHTERRQALMHMDQLTDSLTVTILRAIDDWMPVGAVKAGKLHAAARLDVMKDFLRGEQFYRHADWDSARVQYERVLAADSGFVPAIRRMGHVLGREALFTDSAAEAYLLRSGALNHALGERDSLLVLADSLAAAASRAPTPLAEWPLSRRLFEVLDTATARFPQDPEVWLTLGEARYHFGFGPVRGVPGQAAMDAFERAIGLDSAFAPAYAHVAELALTIGGAPLAQRYLEASLRLAPNERTLPAARLLQRLLDAGDAAAPEVARMLDTLPAEVLFAARTATRRWPDSAETSLRLHRLLYAGNRPSRYPLFADREFLGRLLAEQLAFRGHLREARTVAGDRDAAVVFELAALAGTRADSATIRRVARLVQRGSPYEEMALAWWAARGDRAALQDFLSRARERVRTARSADERLTASYDTAAALAHLALSRGDSTEALRRLAALPDTLCVRCYGDRLARARLELARGRPREALADLREPLAAPQSPFEVLFALERGRAAARIGDRDAAASAYRLVAEAWRHADEELRPYVAEANHALERLESTAPH